MLIAIQLPHLSRGPVALQILRHQKGKERKKTASLPLPGPTNKKQKRVEKKICPKKKLAYELTQEELDEEVDREVKEHFKPKIQEKRVPVDREIEVKVYS